MRKVKLYETVILEVLCSYLSFDTSRSCLFVLKAHGMQLDAMLKIIHQKNS